jgi:hypothetical protein
LTTKTLAITPEEREKQIFCDRIIFITEECEKLEKCDQVQEVNKQIKLKTDISQLLIQYCYLNCIKKFYPEQTKQQANQEIKSYIKQTCNRDIKLN